MKRYIKNKIKKLAPFFIGPALFISCSEDFLEPDPLSFYEPETTFSTESGLKATIAIADRALRGFWIHYSGAYNNVPISTEYVFSDMAKYGKSDASNTIADYANTIIPTGTFQVNPSDNIYLGYYWEEGYNGIKYANTVLSYIDDVEGLSEDVKNKYKGQALFHRAYRYLNLVYQFGDVPLITKILEVPKQNYYSTKKSAIIEMITADMENAVEWVPEQGQLEFKGLVNKAACRQLLIKCYLASGRFQEAEEQANILIDQSGYSLMQNPFGQFDEGGNSQTWEITRNVIWDLHRPENKVLSENTEALMIMPNDGAQSFLYFMSMRIFGPFWNSGNIITPTDGKRGANRFGLNSSNYDPNFDYARAFGRGIATVSASYYSQKPMWVVNGIEDTQDLRHNNEVGNWVNMEDLKYSDPSSVDYGENFRMYDDNGRLIVKDSIRDWFDFPLYKLYLHDVESENNQASSDFRGATTGSKAHWYLYRLAETYLLRAEARFYQGNIPGATQDVNTIRARADASQMYSAVTIGDICAERGRELYLEEWRNVELTRISHCLAISGMPDEWGNTYDVNTWDKQSGTDNAGGSYWYQRIVHYTLYNKHPEGIVIPNGTKYYTMDKRNVYWPVPNSAITANTKGQLSQNYGYDGYDPSIKMWDNWQDAVADEDNID
ncbi:RagB/SusD family nutrient uptake outer membrane protein [Aestuariibaculum marinum]|uniref:RagB/SusD family nutrient uptake outer membrane protein n=1 Tax=Aestuariibaculum marinum TaxID=2683592 RepID=A0A8J6U6U2_9FLAO|nr:RagB/SusD family nutrient uptake outer membrane protein [Aestuariibaculum marinum]MBD0822851.1 RagB/SusD family nutrient uptake outer membrane protein [Aestuariibaculum marinum]